jgi:hypothetical protein
MENMKRPKVLEELVYKFWPWPGVELLNRTRADFEHASLFPITDQG